MLKSSVTILVVGALLVVSGYLGRNQVPPSTNTTTAAFGPVEYIQAQSSAVIPVTGGETGK